MSSSSNHNLSNNNNGSIRSSQSSVVRANVNASSVSRRQADKAPRQNRKVLSEHEYTSTLTDIVQRDYFPDVPELRKQAAVLERRAVGDVQGAVALRRAARTLQQHEQALAEEEERAESEVGDLNVRKVARPLHRESVSGFHARVTSEDNAEFDANQQRQVQEHRKRLRQVFSNTNQQQQLIANHPHASSEHSTTAITTRRRAHETPLLLASDQFNPSPHRVAASEWKATSTSNGLFGDPLLPFGGSNNDDDDDDARDKEDAPSAAPSEKLLANSEQKGKPSTTTTSAATSSITNHDLQLMPPPPARRGGADAHNRAKEQSLSIKDNDSNSALPLQTTVSKQHRVEFIPKHVLEKRIEPSRTRFPVGPSPSSLVVATPLVGGNVVDDDPSLSLSSTDYSTEASTDLDDAPRVSIHMERRARAKRQKRELESLVQMTPQIVPGGANRQSTLSSLPTAAPSGNESPIVTWGTVSATPLVLSGASGREVVEEKANASQFRLPEASKRDEVARRAQATLETRRRKTSSKTRRASSNPSVLETRTTKTAASLTPAAQSLLHKSTMARNATSLSSSSSAIRSKGAFSSALRSSYTPKRATSKSSRRRDSADKATPRLVSSANKKPVLPARDADKTGATGNLTDGLLKLPK